LRRIPRVSGIGRRIGAWVWAEVAGFVHVDPESIDVESAVGVEEREELVVPVALCSRSEPIGEDL